VLILASASPRRADLLAAAGFDFAVRPVDLDERPLEGEAAADCVVRLAGAKAAAAARGGADEVVLAADTMVVVDGLMLGKPGDDQDAVRMLRLLSGRDHQVLTGVAVRADGRCLTACETSTVEFLRLGEDEIGWYVASGEPRDKAGAYAVQGLASRFVTRITGSYSNVVGLPVATVFRMLCTLRPGAWGSRAPTVPAIRQTD
jgi:nucleoside triphosphate pyrophosphatase